MGANTADDDVDAIMMVERKVSNNAKVRGLVTADEHEVLRCSVEFNGNEKTLDDFVISESTPWQVLLETVRRCVGNIEEETRIVSLAYLSIDPKEKLVMVRDSLGVRRAVVSMRQSYQMRKRVVVESLVVKAVKDLIPSSEGNNIKEAAVTLQELVASGLLNRMVLESLVPVLCKALDLQQSNVKSYDLDARTALELASYALLSLDNNDAEQETIRRRFFGGENCLVRSLVAADPELGLSLAAIEALRAASKLKEGARAILAPVTFGDLLAKTKDLTDPHSAVLAMDAICVSLLSHEGSRETWRLASLKGPVDLMMSKSSCWSVQRSLLAMLGAATRHQVLNDSIEAEEELEDDTDDDVDDESMDVVPKALVPVVPRRKSTIFPSRRRSSMGPLMYGIVDHAKDLKHDEEVRLRTLDMEAAVKTWPVLLAQKDVLEALLKTAHAAAAALIPDAETLPIIVDPKTKTARVQEKKIVVEPEKPTEKTEKSHMAAPLRRSSTKAPTKGFSTVRSVSGRSFRKASSKEQFIMAATPPRSPSILNSYRKMMIFSEVGKRHQLKVTVARSEVEIGGSLLKSSCASCLETAALVMWGCALSLTGDETWLLPKHLEDMMRIALFPIAPKPFLRAGVLAAAALEAACRHARYAKLLSEAPGVVSGIRLLLERRSIPVLQCFALRTLQSMLQVSNQVRDELVAHDFRDYLIRRILLNLKQGKKKKKKKGVLPAPEQLTQDDRLANHFVTLAAHLLSTITELSLMHVADDNSKDDDEEVEISDDDDDEESKMKESDVPDNVKKKKKRRFSIHASAPVSSLQEATAESSSSNGPLNLLRLTMSGMATYMHLVLSLLSNGPPESIRHTMMHVWLLARVPAMRADLAGEDHAVLKIILPRLTCFVFEVVEPGSLLPVPEMHGLLEQLEKSERSATLETTAATLWALLQEDTARLACSSYFDTLVSQVVVLSAPALGVSRRVLMCCVWQLAHSDPELRLRLLTQPLNAFFGECLEEAGFGTKLFLELLGEIGLDQTQSTELRLVAMRFFYYFVVLKEVDDAPFGTLAELTIAMLGTESPRAREDAARILACEARSTQRKASLAAAGAVEALVRALKLNGDESDDNVVPLLHALFNLSTHEPNQCRTIRAGLGLFLHHARGKGSISQKKLNNNNNNNDDQSSRATAFATRILENCRHQPQTASMYYKCELRLKTEKLKQLRDTATEQYGEQKKSPRPPKGQKVIIKVEDEEQEESALAALKSRFDAFLVDSFDGGDPDAVSVRTKRPETSDDKRPPMPTLNAELSRSLLDVWKQARPPTSGLSGVPKFSPRSTWSPRIQRCQMMMIGGPEQQSAAPGAQAAPKPAPSSSRRSSLAEGEEKPPPKFEKPPPKFEKLPTMLPSPRAKKKKNPLTTHLLLARAKKQTPCRIALEGGDNFRFNMPVEATLSDDDDEEEEEFFEEEGGTTTTQMAQWRGVPGSKVSTGLYETFDLPDGTKTHYYLRNRAHCQFVERAKAEPIAPPSNFDGIVIRGEQRPAAPLLVASFLPAVYVPLESNEALSRTTIQVLAKLGTTAVATAVENNTFGNVNVPCTLRLALRETGLRRSSMLNVHAAVKEQKPAEVKTLTLDHSVVWKARGSTADASSPRDWLHGAAFRQRCLDCDWHQMLRRKHFVSRLRAVVGEEQLDDELRSLKIALSLNYETTSAVFHFFAAYYGMGSMCHALTEEGYKECVDACGLLGGGGRKNTVPAPLVTSIFIEANSEDRQSEGFDDGGPVCVQRDLTRVGDSSVALLARFEFQIALVLLALALPTTEDPDRSPAMAFEALVRQKIKKNASNVEPLCMHLADDFRRECLYRDDVEKALQPHLPTLTELFNLYATAFSADDKKQKEEKEPEEGEEEVLVAVVVEEHHPQERRLSIVDWVRLFNDAEFFDEDFVRHEARLAFTWSQMRVADPSRNPSEYQTLTLTDFVEALCRVSAVKTWPSDALITDPALCPDVISALKYFDDIENLNDDVNANKSHFQVPCGYFDWPQHNIADRVLKCLLTLYRRIGHLHKHASDEGPMRALKQGLRIVLNQLNLGKTAPAEDAKEDEHLDATPQAFTRQLSMSPDDVDLTAGPGRSPGSSPKKPKLLQLISSGAM